MNPIANNFIVTERLANSTVVPAADALKMPIPIHGACQVLIEVTEGQILINGTFVTKTITDSDGNVYPGVRVIELGYPYLLTGSLHIERNPGYTGIVKMCWEITTPIKE